MAWCYPSRIYESYIFSISPGKKRVHACKHIHWFVFRSLCFVFCAFQTKNKNIAFNHFTCFSMFYFVEEWDQNDFTSCCCCVVCSRTTIFLFLKFPSVLRCVYKYINPNFINTNTSYHSANARIKYLLVGTCGVSMNVWLLCIFLMMLNSAEKRRQRRILIALDENKCQSSYVLLIRLPRFSFSQKTTKIRAHQLQHFWIWIMKTVRASSTPIHFPA